MANATLHSCCKATSACPLATAATTRWSASGPQLRWTFLEPSHSLITADWSPCASPTGGGRPAVEQQGVTPENPFWAGSEPSGDWLGKSAPGVCPLTLPPAPLRVEAAAYLLQPGRALARGRDHVSPAAVGFCCAVSAESPKFSENCAGEGIDVLLLPGGKQQGMQ